MRERGCASGRSGLVPPAIPRGMLGLKRHDNFSKDHKRYRADSTGTTGLLDRYLGVWVYWVVEDQVVSEKRKSRLLSDIIDHGEIKLDYVKLTMILN